MLEIRLMNINELHGAVNLANEVYEQCVKRYVGVPDMVRQYYDYVQPEELCRQMREGHLFLWGAFENGVLCGVSAMQHSGHITMLYVRPCFQRRGIGSLLVRHMLMFADKARKLERVTVNVIPVAAAGYFYRRGFCPANRQNAGQPFAALVYTFPKNRKRDNTDRITYPVKKVKTGTVLWLAVATLLLAFGIGSATTIRYMAQEEVQTQSDAQRQQE